MTTPQPRPMDSAPRDGKLIRLLVDYSRETNAADAAKTEAAGYVWDPNPFEDDVQAWTVGFNSHDNTGEDVWELAGWNWSQDCFTEGHGTPIGWLPLHPEADVYSQEQALLEWLLRIQRAAKVVVFAGEGTPMGESLLGALNQAVNGVSPPGWDGAPTEPSYSRLRDEVAYWRANAAAMLWGGMIQAKASRAKGEEDRAITYDIAVIQPMRAALANAIDGDLYYPRCIGCDVPVQAGDALVAYDEGELAHIDCADPQKAELPPEGHRHVADPEDGPEWPAKILAEAVAYLKAGD